MATIEIISALDKRIRLTLPQWEHIIEHHPEMAGQQNRFKEVLEAPDFVVRSIKDDVIHYVRHYKKTPVTEKYLLLIAKHLNGDGFIITAFFMNRIRKKDKEVLYGQKNYDRL